MSKFEKYGWLNNPSFQIVKNLFDINNARRQPGDKEAFEKLRGRPQSSESKAIDAFLTQMGSSTFDDFNKPGGFRLFMDCLNEALKTQTSDKI